MKEIKSITIIVMLVFLTVVPISNVTAISTTGSIEYWVTPKVVHIKNDEFLKTYLSQDYCRNTTQMVCDSKNKYKLIYDSEIAITDQSMGIEIIGHVFTDAVSKYLPKWLAIIIQNHTAVIDSGESSVDKDRWIWDSISVVLGHYNEIILADKRNKYITSESIVDIIYNTNINRTVIRLDREIMLKVVNDIRINEINPILLNDFVIH
ncbi:hypothetical protein [Vagococcus fessus]|uniref:Uncharacterized protein n=1 Tax=Vagococcus fessus TaxID=120370 RepID=A0A430ABZ1_9ENTE|nr:hypothetical protein [Vagococcus fessus]RSU04658.1 hypothetical protein CBF31_01170 [Vagococcus fessus]